MKYRLEKVFSNWTDVRRSGVPFDKSDLLAIDSCSWEAGVRHFISLVHSFLVLDQGIRFGAMSSE